MYVPNAVFTQENQRYLKKSVCTDVLKYTFGVTVSTAGTARVCTDLALNYIKILLLQLSLFSYWCLDLFQQKLSKIAYLREINFEGRHFLSNFHLI